MADLLDFSDLTPIQLKVRIGAQEYILREASGDAACRYRNALLECTELDSDGKPKVLRNLANTETLLVSLCLFTKDGKPVPEATIRSWPARIVKRLFEQAKLISELDESTTLDGLRAQREALDERIRQLEKEGEPVKNG